MTLTEYLTRQNLTDAEFAVKIERDQSTVNRLRRGKTRPDWETISAIVTATQGCVTANDFIASASDETREAAQ